MFKALMVFVYWIDVNFAKACYNSTTACNDINELCRFRISPNHSVLHWNGTGHLGVNCEVTSDCLNETLSQLPTDISYLTLTVDTFPNSGVSFTKFDVLKNLSILWKYETDDSLPQEQNELTDSGLFSQMERLESLQISIPTVNITDTLLHDLHHLKVLDITNIGYFTTKKFAALFHGSQLNNKPLETLILRRMSGVNTARDRLFLLGELLPLLKHSNIKTLDLSDNRVLYLYPGLTQYLPHLETLNLHGNTVRYMSHNGEAVCLFLELLWLHKNIRSLDLTKMGDIGKEIDYLGRNFITKVGICAVLGQLENKTLAQCICEHFNTTCGMFIPNFINCNLLPEYQLSELIHREPVDYNPPRYCQWGILLPIPTNLETIRISKSQVVFPSSQWFNKTFCFGPNNLTVLDVSYMTFDIAMYTTLFVGFDQLIELDFAYSSWSNFFHNPKLLHQVPRLEVLNMTGTNVGLYIRNDTHCLIFKKSLQLRKLYLSAAQITFIPLREFENLHQLELLDLSGNHLTEITFLVSSLNSLSLLNISHNSLYQLTSNVTDNLDALIANSSEVVMIDLNFNTFICDCPSIRFIKWISATKFHLLNKTSFLCTYEGRQQMSLVAVNVNKLICHCYGAYIATFIVIGLALIIILTSFTVYKYRWNIRTWFLKVANSGHYKGDTVPYKYDGFVVYSDEDRQWVHNFMLDEIENVRNLKLCVHHRDFLPGDDIDEQIVRSVDNSRKTLLILTKNFLASEWCLYEMKVAWNKLQAEGKDVIIPILLAELPVDNMNLSVKNLLREKTYLQWETSMGGQAYFWKKLEIALRGPNLKQKPKLTTENTEQTEVKKGALLNTSYPALYSIANDNSRHIRYGTFGDHVKSQ